MKRNRKFFGARMILAVSVVLLGLAFIYAVVSAQPASVMIETGEYRLISHSASGEIGNDKSYHSVISEDGNVIAFDSLASNLVDDDTNGTSDVFVVDLIADTIERVSVSAAGAQANGESFYPQIGSDGRYVVFSSMATNLTEDGGSEFSDIYLLDRQEDTIVKITKSVSGGAVNGLSKSFDMSANDEFVVFASDATNLVEGEPDGVRSIFLYEIATGIVSKVEIAPVGVVPDRGVDDAKISGDGRYLVFVSYATNLVPSDTNDNRDVFLLDRITGELELISKGNDGTPCERGCYSADISNDGNWVVFETSSDGLVPEDENGKSDLFLYDVVKDDLSLLDDIDGLEHHTSSRGDMIDAIGRRFTYYDYSNHLINGLFYDRYVDRTQLYGPQYEAVPEDISADGKRVVFYTSRTVIPDYPSPSKYQVYLYDVNKISLVDEIYYPHHEEELDGDPTPDLFIWLGLFSVDDYTVQIFNTDTDTKVFEETINEYDACFPYHLCGIALDQNLPDGAYQWRVKASNATEEADWTEWKGFLVNPPPTPTPRFPKNEYEMTVGTTIFKWTAVDGVRGYEIALSRLDRGVFDTFLLGTDVCEDGICQYKLPYKLGVEYNRFYWEVRGLNETVNSAWSDIAVFIYAKLDTPQLENPNPNALVRTSTPTFTWSASTQNVFRYDLEIWTIDGNLAAAKSFAADAICNDDTCSWKPDTALPDGVYTWHVLGKKFPNNSGWSTSRVFTMDTAGGVDRWPGLAWEDAFEAPLAIYPKNDHEITVGTSLIKWGTVDGATSYVLELYNQKSEWYDAWEIASSVCDATTCQFKIPYKLGTEFGHWSWRVRAKDGDSVGTWSNSANFTYFLLHRINVIAPVDGVEVESTTPTLSWEDSSQGLFKYVVEIWTADGSLVATQTLSPGAVCSEGTCSWTSTTTLTAGEEYKWRVLGKKWPNITTWTDMETFSIAD